MLDAHYGQPPAYQLSPKQQQLAQRSGIHYLHEARDQYQHDASAPAQTLGASLHAQLRMYQNSKDMDK